MAYRVLIVDDSPVMRKFIRRVLDLTGLEIGEAFDAGNGQEALDLLEKNWVDIVLTDINMPVMNGEQFLQRMVKDPLFISIPVLVVSTDRSEARLTRMLSLGAKVYVTKPFLPETLRDAMQRLFNGGHHANN